MNLNHDTKLNDDDIQVIAAALAARLTQHGLASLDWLGNVIAGSLRSDLTPGIVVLVAKSLISAEPPEQDPCRFQMVAALHDAPLMRMVEKSDWSGRENLVALGEIIKAEIAIEPQSFIDLQVTLAVGPGVWEPLENEIRAMVSTMVLHPNEPFTGSSYDLSLTLQYLDPRRN